MRTQPDRCNFIAGTEQFLKRGDGDVHALGIATAIAFIVKRAHHLHHDAVNTNLFPNRIDIFTEHALGNDRADHRNLAHVSIVEWVDLAAQRKGHTFLDFKEFIRHAMHGKITGFITVHDGDTAALVGRRNHPNAFYLPLDRVNIVKR